MGDAAALSIELWSRFQGHDLARTQKPTTLAGQQALRAFGSLAQCQGSQPNAELETQCPWANLVQEQWLPNPTRLESQYTGTSLGLHVCIELPSSTGLGT